MVSPHALAYTNALTLLTYNAVKAGRTLSIAKLVILPTHFWFKSKHNLWCQKLGSGLIGMMFVLMTRSIP